MTKKEFIQEALKRKLDPKEIVDLAERIEAAGRFDPEPELESSPAEKYGAAGALLPSVTESTEKGGNLPTRTVAAVGDILNLPQRTIASVATLAGYVQGGGKLKDAIEEAKKELSKTKSEETGALGLIQNLALDPAMSPILGLATPALAVKVAKGTPTIGKAVLGGLKIGAPAGAASSAYQQAGRGEIDPAQTAVAATMAGLLTAGQAGLGHAITSKTGTALQKAGAKTVASMLKGGKTGGKLGFDPKAVIKHNVTANTPEGVYVKATQKIESLKQRAYEIAQKEELKVDLEDVFNSAKQSVDKRKYPEEYADIINKIDDLKTKYINAFGKEVTAPDIMEIRTRIGENVDFVGKPTGGYAANREAGISEKAHNEIYYQLKNILHNKLKEGTELQKIDKAISELVPIKTVAAGRMPIYESNKFIGLSDIGLARIGQALGAGATGSGIGYATSPEDRLGGALKGAAVGIALPLTVRAVTSPKAGQVYYKIGEKIIPQKGFIIKGKESPTIGSLKKVLSNERGSIADVPDETVIQAILDAAERHGGIQNIERITTRPTFRESISEGYFWYNTPDKSTHVVPIKSKEAITWNRGRR